MVHQCGSLGGSVLQLLTVHDFVNDGVSEWAHLRSGGVDEGDGLQEWEGVEGALAGLEFVGAEVTERGYFVFVAESVEGDVCFDAIYGVL